MKTKRVMIAQKMNGIPEEEVMAKRQEIIDYLNGHINDYIRAYAECEDEDEYEEIELEFVDNYHHPAPEKELNHERLWYLGQSIQNMSDVDIVIFADGYQEAKGCLIEKHICELYGVTHIEWSEIKEGAKFFGV